MAFTLKDAQSAFRAYKEARVGNVVDEDEILRRAQVCLACPLRRILRVTPRDQLNKAVAARANKHRVPDTIKAYKCGACSCPLMLLLPAKNERLHHDTPAQAAVRSKKAPQCWVPQAIADANGDQP